MLIAKKLKKSNITEYLIYMFQIEALIRSNNNDITLLNEVLISKYKLKENELIEVYKWYEALCRMMIEEKPTKDEHLQFITNQINELYDFHIRLLEFTNDEEYLKAFNKAKADIETLKIKLKLETKSDIEVCVYGMYVVLVMRIKQSNFSIETLEGITNISKLLSLLSKKYHEFECGKIEL